MGFVVHCPFLVLFMLYSTHCHVPGWIVICLTASLTYIVLTIEPTQGESKTSATHLWSMELAVDESEKRILAILESCGTICDTRAQLGSKEASTGMVMKSFHCSKLLQDFHHDSPGLRYLSEVPKMAPTGIINAFTYNNRIGISYEYKGFDLAPVRDWSKEAIDDNAQLIQSQNFQIGYNDEKVQEMYEILVNHVLVYNKRVLVIGRNDNPWLETILVALGARSIVTLDWRGVQCNHSKIEVIQTRGLSKVFQTDPGFDLVIAYDSLQRLGLGRLGDGLHPWLDIVTLARAWCLTVQGGHLLSIIPSNVMDHIVFNSHRIYGPLMELHLFANWRRLWTMPSTEFNDNGYPYEIKFSYHGKVQQISP